MKEEAIKDELKSIDKSIKFIKDRLRVADGFIRPIRYQGVLVHLRNRKLDLEVKLTCIHKK